MSNFEDARIAFSAALEIAPEAPVAVHGLANCLYVSSMLNYKFGALGRAAEENTMALALLNGFTAKHEKTKVKIECDEIAYRVLDLL